MRGDSVRMVGRSGRRLHILVDLARGRAKLPYRFRTVNTRASCFTVTYRAQAEWFEFHKKRALTVNLVRNIISSKAVVRFSFAL